MDRIEAMDILLAVVAQGGFSPAARALVLPVQTVSRKVADLERHLGTQLLIRTTRSVALTDAGTAFVAAARRIVDAMAEAEREAVGEFVTPKGELVITAPRFFGRLHVLPIVTDFLRLFPEIDVRLVLGDRNVNLLDDQVDMAVRIGRLPDSSMIATGVGAMRAVVAAGTAFLAGHGRPKTPQDLSAMACIMADGPLSSAGWRFRDPADRREFTVAIQPRLLTSAEAAVAAAVAGAGLVRALHYQVDEPVRSGQMAIVLERHEIEPLPVHLVHLPRGQMPLKMRRFIDFAAPRLRQAVAEVGRP